MFTPIAAKTMAKLSSSSSYKLKANNMRITYFNQIKEKYKTEVDKG